MAAMNIDNENDISITLMIVNPGKDDTFENFKVPDTTSLASLKLVIEAQCEVPAAQQALYHKNLYLRDDSKTLKELSVQTNDVMVLRKKVEESKENESNKTSNTSQNTNNNTNNNNNNNPNNSNSNNSNTNSNSNSNASSSNNNTNSNSNVVAGIDLGMPLFGPNAPLPQMPSFLRMNASTLQQQLRSDANTLTQLLHSNPTLAQAVLSDDLTLLEAYLQNQRMEFAQKLQKEQQRRAEIMRDPLNPEYQQLIEQEIYQENINQNYETAVEEMPEAFGQVVMLYVPMEVEGVKVNAFIDSGAQSTIMSREMAERCGIMRLVDRRFHGIAKGVGTAKIVGRIHIVKIKFGSIYLPTSLTILDDPSMEFLFGLDMLRRHRACIDLEKGVLRIHEQEVQFLQEKDIPHLRQRNLVESLETAQRQQQAQQQQGGSMASAANSNNNNNNNNNSNSNSGASNADSAVTTSGGGASANNNNNNNNNGNSSSANNNNNGNFDLMGTILGALGGAANNNNNNNNNGGAAYNRQRGTNSSNNNLNENDIQSLMGLGFSRQQVIQALRATGGNAEMAASLLFQSQGGLGF